MVKIQKFSSPKNHSKATKKHLTPRLGPSFEYSNVEKIKSTKLGSMHDKVEKPA